MRNIMLIAIRLPAVLLAGCFEAEPRLDSPDQRPGLGPGECIYLTHDFSAETLYWPTSDPFKLETVAEGVNDKGFYYSAYKFCAAEHGGTHIDAPVHFSAGR